MLQSTERTRHGQGNPDHVRLRRPRGARPLLGRGADYQRQPPPEGFGSWEEALTAWGVPADQQGDKDALVDPDGAGPRVFFQKVPEGKTAKNRVHLDVRAAPGLRGDERMAALEAEAARLVELGARRGSRFEPGGMSAGFIVMTDPEGNEFCLD